MKIYNVPTVIWDPKKRMDTYERLQRITAAAAATKPAATSSRSSSKSTHSKSVQPKSKSIEIVEEQVDLGEDLPVTVRSRSRSRLPPTAIKAVLQQPLQQPELLKKYKPPAVLTTQQVVPYPLDDFVPINLRYTRDRFRLTELLRNVLSDKNPRQQKARANISAVLRAANIGSIDQLDDIPDRNFHVIMNRLVRTPAELKVKVSGVQFASQKQPILPPVPLTKSKMERMMKSVERQKKSAEKRRLLAFKEYGPKAKPTTKLTLAQKLAALRQKFSAKKQ